MSNDDKDLEAADLAQRRICSECVDEPYLRAELDKNGEDAECYYCKGVGKTISIDELADYVEKAFDDHYERTSSEPEGIEYLLAKEGLWERHGEPVAEVIGDVAQIGELPAEHVREVLSERHFDFDEAALGGENPFEDGAHYQESGVFDRELQMAWRHFQESLRKEARFFNREAESVLKTVFEDLDGHVTLDGRPVIVDAGPGTGLISLYRARVFQSDDRLQEAIKRPDLELGPPPFRVASAGRMNARGIAVFYGATTPNVALAETRPPVGGKVAVARFDVIRPLRLLDIEALRSLYVSGSVFDPTFNGRLKKRKFLGTLSHRITEPVMPDDEPSEYLITQAIADYLAAQNEPTLDGIIYPSVQNGGDAKNVVLFHKSARVEAVKLPVGTIISAYTSSFDEDGSYPDYSVYEEVPTEKSRSDVKSQGIEEDADFLEPQLQADMKPRNEDVREAALRVAMDSVRVLHVRRTEYQVDEHEVTRHRIEKRDRGEPDDF